MAGNKVFCELHGALLSCTFLLFFLYLHHFVSTQCIDWNILNGEQTKEIATKVPTNLEELAECMLPENFQKEYGDRLLKNINAYIDSEKLHSCIENRPTKKHKRGGAPDSQDVIIVDEFDDGIDYAAIELPVTQNSSSDSKLKSKKSSYFPKA